jgi:hypothetical protein
MDVDPVVGKRRRLVHDQTHRQEVTIGQPGRRLADLGRRWRTEGAHELADGHARDEVAGDQRARAIRAGDDDALHAPLAAVDADHLGVQQDAAASPLDLTLHGVPHHARAETRVIELFDERADGPAGSDEHAQDGRAQREIHDALRRPFGAQRRARDSPDLLRAGLEEGLEQPLAEAIGHPLFERVLARARKYLPPEIAQHGENARAEPEPQQGIERTKRVVEELSVVVDAGEPGPADEILAEHLAPQLFDLRDLGVEAVTAQVEAEALEGRGARQSADVIELLQDGGAKPEPRQLVRGGQAARPAAHDQKGALGLAFGRRGRRWGFSHRESPPE